MTDVRETREDQEEEKISWKLGIKEAMTKSIPLWDHQKKAVEKARGKLGFALFLEMGCGKSAAAIHILQEKYAHHKRPLMKTLILCPPIVVQNWKREFGMHSKIKAQDIVCLTGSAKKRIELFKKQAWANKIIITNYEALLMKDLFELLKTWAPEALVCDESHRLKDPTTKRSKLTQELSSYCIYKLILSGTPILNTPMDIFSQYRILDNGFSFGKNFFAFRAQYFYDKNQYMPKHVHFPNWQVKPNAIEEIRAKMEPNSMSVKKEECLTLPPLVRKTIYVELGEEQAKVYESMKRDFIAYVGSDACVATLAITKALRLQQILSGFVPTGEGSEQKIHRFKMNPRLEAAKELLEEITSHSKIIVWAVFKEDFKQLGEICEKLKLNYSEVHGEISAKKKDEGVDRFNTDPAVRVLIGHPFSGGLGINLVAASYSLFYSRNFSLEQDLQATARNHRGGSEIHTKITRLDLVAKGTLDELILERLKNKEAIGDSLIKQIAKELNSGNEESNDRPVRKTSRRSL